MLLLQLIRKTVNWHIKYAWIKIVCGVMAVHKINIKTSY